MEQWEYWTTFLWANIENQGALEFVQKKFPDWKSAKFAPQTMMPQLDRFGEKVWELVHLEPVRAVGKNMDVFFSSGGEISHTDWSNVYFCVFKRIKQG
jgi:hypothetical protein